MAWLNGSAAPELQRLLVPFVCALIAFLAYAPQWLFAHSPDLAPGPLTPAESRLFNALVACLWWTYYKAVTVDPGRYVFPPGLRKRYEEEKKKGKKRSSSNVNKNNNGEDEDDDDDGDDDVLAAALRKRRWCKKCAAPKPPRAHHCRTCRRCVPRMDHHCPWTANCVSLQTFPYFVRFLAWACAALAVLLHHVWRRLAALWAARHLPAYLGPPAPHLALLAAVALVGAVTLGLLAILLGTTVRGWLFNVTMIEAWEIERHEAVLERSPGYRGDGRDGDSDDAGGGGGGGGDRDGWWRSGESAPGGDLSAPHLAVDPVEFPYDVGVFANMAQAMGTRNVLLWFWPFAGGPTVAPFSAPSASPSPSDYDTTGYWDEGMGMIRLPAGTGWSYEENGLNDREGMWPPVDPEKARHARLWRQRRREMLATEADADARYYGGGGSGGGGGKGYRTPHEEREAFRRRQERDLRRWRGTRARIMGELEEVGVEYDDYDDEREQEHDHGYDYDGGAGGGVILDQAELPVSSSGSRSGSGSSWVNADGEKLGDYGVDDDEDEDEDDDDPPVVVDKRLIPPLGSAGGGDAGGEDDEDVPLAELIRRRKVLTKDGEDT
ncbi:Palmitoyltransferase [Diatrype stigma]|uniref:Palmitoyltransferase PFA4 n=1 Tax=Diatrype stigma TaxID=117547 RepID=A0AAN9UYF8_9PEZI